MSTFTCKAEGDARAADATAVRRALEILIGLGQTFEIRGLWRAPDFARSRVCRTIDQGVDAACAAEDAAGVYFTLNPCREGLERAASNGDIVSRRWILIDCDPVRPADLSSTDEEFGASLTLACSIAEHLSAEGWPDPVWIESGNGAHLLYPCDLPADKLAQQLVRDALNALGDRFDTPGAKVDRAVHNAARISKLPGTWVRKGPDTPERPHRLARLASAPSDPGEIVTAEMLRALAKPKAEAPGAAPPPWTAVATGGAGLSRYVKSAVDRECARVLMAPEGTRNNALNTAAFNLGTLAAWPELNVADAKIDLRNAATRAGLTEHETKLTIESGWTAGAKEGRPRPIEQAFKATRPDPERPAPTGRIIILASEVTPRKVEWLWPDRIPIGKLTTFAGWGGLGKSFVTMDLAARISRGDEIPGGKGECFDQGNVLILNTEDDPDDTSVPRLIEAGADLSRVAFAKSEVLGQFILSDLKTLDAMLDQLGGARMVVIDPAASHLGGANDHKNSELRAMLTPLSLWAMQRQVAVILVTHVCKPSAGKVEAMARVVGGVAWVNAVRAAVMFSKDPDNPAQRLFIPFKANNAPEMKGLAYRVVPTDALAKVEWIGEVDTTADEAMSQPAKKSRGVNAVEWLTERFRERREWPSDELKRMAAAAGLSKNALWSDEVKALPIRHVQRYVDGANAWFWEALHGWPEEISGNRESGNLPT